MTGPRVEKGHWVFPEKSEKPAARPNQKRRKAKKRPLPREIARAERQAAIERVPGVRYGPDARPTLGPGTRAYDRLQRELEQSAVQPADPTRTQFRRKVKRQ